MTNCQHFTYHSKKGIKAPWCLLNRVWQPMCSECKDKSYKPIKPIKKSAKPLKNRSSKLSKACDIPQSVRDIVEARDKGICVICKVNKGEPNMHYIARSQLGLGIEQNIVCGCLKCHTEYDNGKYREHHGEVIKRYLQNKYENWNEEDLIYKKWK